MVYLAGYEPHMGRYEAIAIVLGSKLCKANTVILSSYPYFQTSAFPRLQLFGFSNRNLYSIFHTNLEGSLITFTEHQKIYRHYPIT